jgi:hypothetical protein
MGTFGGGVFGGPGGGDLVTVVTAVVSDLIYHALRLAGVTTGPERKPSGPQYRDGLMAANRMLQRWNTDGLLVPNIQVEAFPLIPGQKKYTMGPGGDFSTGRPQRIERANLLRSDGTRRHVGVVTVDDWARISVQDQAGETCELYNDRAAGLVNLYLYPQVTESDSQLELYTWKLLERLTELAQEVTWQDGYEEAFVHNLALRLAAMPFPGKEPMDPEVRELARQSLSDIASLNAPAPTMACDGAVMPQRWGGFYDITTNE